MPVYEYRCDNGHTFEVLQRMSDEPVERCDSCGAPVQRVFHPVAVHFKGSGFYNTDYGKRSRGASSSSSEESPSKPESSGSSKSESSGSDKSASATASSD